MKSFGNTSFGNTVQGRAAKAAYNAGWQDSADRYRQFLALPEARNRQDLAAHLAIGTSVTLDEARSILAKAAIEGGAGGSRSYVSPAAAMANMKALVAKAGGSS